ncbi:MAG: serine/threonine protein kinase [Myxococcota bacterium]
MTEDSAEAKLLKEGRYRILGLLGRGAQADTLWGEDTLGGGHVAIKRFQVRGAKSWKDVELAEREASVLSRLSHPNLPKYLDHFEEDGALYLVMQKIEGSTLAELRARGALDQALMRRFLTDLGDTLEYLHALSPPIVHRDIKPQNVILRPDGGFSLVDFGSVREKLRPEGGSTVVGTFGYMAPEQFQGRAGPATDVYGAGATAIACLTGIDPEELPHRGLAIDVQQALRGQVDASWVELLTRLLEPNPDQRPRSLKNALATTLNRGPRVSSAQPRASWVPPLRDPLDLPSLPGLSRKQARRLEKQARRARKDARRAARRARTGNRIARMPGWFWILLVVGISLFAARLVVTGVLRIALPILLSVLALVFGAGLRRAARRTMHAGERADAAIGRAIDHVRGVPPSVHEGTPRMRVDDDLPPFHAHDDAEHGFPTETRANSRTSR